MPLRTLNLASGEIYHIFNRGIKPNNIFLKDRDFERFTNLLSYYQQNRNLKYSLLSDKKITLREWNKGWNNLSVGDKLVEIFCYCLMPNHYHILLRQLVDGGITKFIGVVQNSYVRYFNTRYKRNGPLFQGRFKAVHISTDEQLVHVSRYIHLNPCAAGMVKTPGDYKWSSFGSYTQPTEGFVEVPFVLSFFKSSKKYESFVTNHADYAKTLEIIKHQAIDTS